MTKDFLMGEDVNSPFGDHFDEMVRPDLNDEQFDEMIKSKLSARQWEKIMKLNEQSPPGISYMGLTDENGHVTCGKPGGEGCKECAGCYQWYLENTPNPSITYFTSGDFKKMTTLERMRLKYDNNSCPMGGLRRGKFYMIEALVPPHHGRFHVKHHLLAKAIHNQVLDLEVGQHKKGFKINLKSPYLYGTSSRVGTIGDLPTYRSFWPEEVFRQLKREESPFVEYKDNSYYVAGKEILRFISFYHKSNIQRVTHVPGRVLGWAYTGNGNYGAAWCLDKSSYEYPPFYELSFDYTVEREDWVEDAIDSIVYLRLYGEDRMYWSENLNRHIRVSSTGGLKRNSLFGANLKVKLEKEKARKRLHDVENPRRK